MFMTEAGKRLDSCVWGRLRNSIVSLLVMLALVLSIPHSASAQGSASANLSGTVHDSTGAVVPDGNVTLRDTQKGTERKSSTNDAGVYVFTSVPPGVYSLSVAKTGFAPATQQNLTLLVNQDINQDFILRVGSNEQTVTVEASAVNIETGNATLGSVIETKQVTSLPLNGRNYTQLLDLTPGVSPVSTAQNSGGAQTHPIGSFTFPAVNGQTNRSNYFMLDGIDDSEMTFSTYAVAPVIDEIQEFKVQSHNDEVQFGGVTGGIVNVVTKSGTNEYHATAWEYLRNTVLDAKNPFSGLQKLIQNQFGASGGGPVRLPHIYDGRNKTFFYGTYEGFRRIQPIPAGNFYRVPTAAQLGGDFSALCQLGFDAAGVCLDRSAGGQVVHQLYNPFTTTASGSGFVRSPFKNNIIQPGLINANAVNFAKDVFPAPLPVRTVNGVAYNGYDFRSQRTSVQQYSWRIDENFNPSNSLFFRYSSADQTQVGPGGNANFSNIAHVPAKQYVASYYHTFSPTTFFDFQFGHVELTNRPPTTFNGDRAKALADGGFASSFVCGFSGGVCLVPNPGVDQFAPGGEGAGFTTLTDIYDWRGNFTKVIRNHTLTAGFSYETDKLTEDSNSDGLTFSADQTSDPQNGGGNTGYGLASYLLGTAAVGAKRDTAGSTTGQNGFGGYFMDKWKASSRLTLNLGLRYDFQAYPLWGNLKDPVSAVGEIDFNNGTYILQRPVASCANTGNIAPCIPGTSLPANVVISPNNRLWKNTKTNFQPRLGLAYRLTDKMVLRASFGITDDLWAGITQSGQNASGSWPSNSQPLVSSNAIGAPVSVNFQNPIAVTGAPLTNAPPPTPFHQLSFFRDPLEKNPYSEQWNFGLERQFSANTVVTANYVGSQTHRLNVGGLYNTALTPGPNLNPDGTLATTPAEIAAAFAARQLWPGIDPTFYDRGVGNGSYNALQIAARHMGSGLSYLVSYTYSKAIDLGSDGFFGVEGTSVQDPYNLARDRSVAGYDLTHVLSASFNADIPFGKGKRFSSNNAVVDYVVGNWQINGIYTYTSGQPFTVFVPGDGPNIRQNSPSWNNINRPNLVGDPNAGSCPGGAAAGTASCWFNTSAFVRPPVYTFGDLGRNTLRGARFQNLDMSLFKSFPFAEKLRLEFRAEAFNLLNHVNLGQPDATVGDAGFGKVTSTRGTERQLQLALKLFY
jgi:carboxypeptidase family protein